MKTETSGTYVCPLCLQDNEVDIDLTAGTNQTFVQDCGVCCRPLVLTVLYDEELEELLVDVEPES